jgi:hypothetical protein
MPNAGVRQARPFVCPDWNVSCHVRYVVDQAGIPAQLEHRVQIARGGHLIGNTAEVRKAEWPQRPRDVSSQCRIDLADQTH